MLDQLQERTQKASAIARSEIDSEFFDTARNFLARLGVNFDKTKGSDGRSRIDPSRPIVPDWPFDRIKLALEMKAESLLRLPQAGFEPWIEAQTYAGAAVSLALCRSCVHCSLTDECVLGRPVQAWWDEVEPVTDECDKHLALTARVWRMKVATSEAQ